MSAKPGESVAHPYEPEPYPILHGWPKLWWMPEWERSEVEDAIARQYGGCGYLPRKEIARERER